MSELARRSAGLMSLWRNPVFLRFFRSRLRLRKSIFWYLLTLIIATFVVTLVYILRTNSGVAPRDAARSLWLPLLIIQGIILMVKGTGSVSAGLIQDKIDETLDYQRLTPLTPLASLIGYLFGLPVLEYAMALLTVPHLTFVVIVGQVPLGAFVSVYSTFFVCVVLYHMTGIAAGMVMRKWIWGYLLSIFLVVTVNLILPTFVSQLGLKVFQYLSIWPVIGHKMLPLLVPPDVLASVTAQNPFFSMADAVPFFEWSLSPYAYTMLLQGALIATFGVMAHRRWKSSTRHTLSKPYALVFLCAFIVLVLGNLWPAITGQYLPFALFGEVDIDDVSEALAIALPLVYCLIVWWLCMILFAIVIPEHHSYVRGIRRAIKHGRTAARPWDDDSANLGFLSLFVVAAIAGFLVLYGSVAASGFLDFTREAGFGLWRLPLAFGLVLVSTLLLIQVVQLKPTMLVVLLLWLLPILVAVVLSAARQDVTTVQAIIASLSPMALLVMSGMAPLTAIAPQGMGDELNGLMTGVNTGLGFIAIQIVFLTVRWAALRRRFQAACARPSDSGMQENPWRETQAFSPESTAT